MRHPPIALRDERGHISGWVVSGAECAAAAFFVSDRLPAREVELAHYRAEFGEPAPAEEAP